MQKKLRVIVDTNIFIKSWFKNDESCDIILNLIDRNKIKLLFSQETIGELLYIGKKYAIKNMSSVTPRMIILNNIVKMFYNAESTDTSKTKCPRIRDKEDEMFLKCAIKGNSDFLISNDFKSGMHRVEKLKTKVVNSKEFIKMYEELYSINKEIAIIK